MTASIWYLGAKMAVQPKNLLALSLLSLSKTFELTHWTMKFFPFEGWWAGFSFLVVGTVPKRPSLFVRRFLGKLRKYSEDLFTSKGNKEGKYYSLKYKQEEDKTVFYILIGCSREQWKWRLHGKIFYLTSFYSSLSFCLQSPNRWHKFYTFHLKAFYNVYNLYVV